MARPASLVRVIIDYGKRPQMGNSGQSKVNVTRSTIARQILSSRSLSKLSLTRLKKEERMETEKPTEGKEYCVRNRHTKEMQYVVALSAQEACEKLGWMIGDCQVKEVVILHRGHCVV